jgi:hypothetical protein
MATMIDNTERAQELIDASRMPAQRGLDSLHLKKLNEDVTSPIDIALQSQPFQEQVLVRRDECVQTLEFLGEFDQTIPKQILAFLGDSYSD